MDNLLNYESIYDQTHKNPMGGGECVDNHIVEYKKSNSQNSYRNKYFSFLLVCVLALAMFCAESRVFAQFTRITIGDGMSSATAYQISNSAQLEDLADSVNDSSNPRHYAGKYFKVMNDIGFDENYNPPVTKSIGKSATYFFCGNFDGGNNTIKLNINGADYYYAGLFGYLGAGANIHNVKTDGTVRGYYVGGLVGGISVTESGTGKQITISDCTNGADVTNNSEYGTYTGGIVGYVLSYYSNYIKIFNCVNTGVIYSPHYQVGGIVGNSGGNSTSRTIIDQCYNTGSITGEYSTGGIAGSISYTTVKNCYNKGTVVATYDGEEDRYGCGGIVGRNQEGYDTVKNCYNVGNVAGAIDDPNKDSNVAIGGICGSNYTNGYIINCYSGGTVSGAKSYWLGGVVGYNQNNTDYVEYCYCKGSYNIVALGYKKNDWTDYRSNTTRVTNCSTFTHSSNTNDICNLDNPILSTNDLCTVLNKWREDVVHDEVTYLMWVKDANPWENYGMPKFFSCTPVSVTELSVSCGNRECDVTWTAPNATSCKLYYGSDPDINNMWMVNNANSTFTARRLTNGRTYYFVVKPIGSGEYCADNDGASTTATPNCTQP